jgi:hypothetical protein
MSENQNLPGRGLPPETPRWVKMFAVVFIILILVVVGMHLVGFNFGGHMP